MIRDPPLRLYIVLWAPLAAVYAALYLATGRPVTTAIRVTVLSLLPFALLGMAVLRLPRLVPWVEERRLAFFAAHLGLTTAYAVAGAGSVAALWTLDSFLATGSPPRLDPLIVAWQGVLGGLTYVAIVGGAYAWRHAQLAREEAKRTAESEALRARAELGALRSQLNPHFLMNTLHAALGLVRRDPALAEKALERLGDVLHYGLRMHREARDQVTLAEEWTFVGRYLEIESLRLEERLEVRLEDDASLMESPVPPFVLQPLVENAIQHAIAPRKAGGRLVVAARRVEDRLRLEVSDDGPAVSPTAANGSGLGLKLLRERLALLYAGRARLSVEPIEGGGTRAWIELPLEPEGPSRS